MGLVQPVGNENTEFALLNLNDVTKKINNTLDKIKDDFVYIGFLLWEANYYKHYLAKGYFSIVEYAEKELNFKKSTTYNFISVCEKFSSKREKDGYPSMNLDSKFKDFSFTQLIEIKTLSLEQMDSFNPNMSKRQIIEKKKELKSKESNIIDVEFKQDQVDLIENQTIILVDPVPVVKNKDNLSLKQVDSIIENKILKDKIKLFEEEKNNQTIDIQKLIKENSKLKNENLSLKKEDQVVNLDYKENVIKYLTDRLEVLRGLAKGQKKISPNSNDYFEYLGAFHEVDLLLNCIKKDEI